MRSQGASQSIRVGSIGRVGAEAERPAAGGDAEGRRGHAVDGPPALDGERSEGDRLRLVQVDQLEVIVQLLRTGGKAGLLLREFHPGGKQAAPDPGRDVGMHEQPSAAAQREERIVAEIFQAAAVVGVQMSDRDRRDPVEIERDSGRRGSLVEHLPDGVGAVDQDPVVIGPQRQAGGVMAGREGLAHAERNQP